MNILGHYKSAKNEYKFGTFKSILVTLPDIFVVIRKILPFTSEFCLKMHNSEEGIKMVGRFNSTLGQSWAIHKEQDMKSHNYKYDYSDRIPKNSILLLSGGLDSFIQWRLLGQPKAVYFDIGNRARTKEYDKIQKITTDFNANIVIIRNLNLSEFEMRNAYIPYRNMFFLSLASLISPNVVISQISEYAPDKCLPFYRKLERLLNPLRVGKFQGLNMGKVKIYAPFVGFTKTELIREYLKKYPAEDLYKYTWSCYEDGEVPCEKCTSCTSRYIAITNNGLVKESKNIPDLNNFTNKWSYKDFKLSNLKMYYKRIMEIREFRRKISEI
jgi:7-cyano-7-deazaguanine synthase in queuosine biosynthesis